ncbi:acyl-coenzyme A synthetase/AMP-(fatty) acid ligase [Cupriavidus alkaliphilus]|nr:acyl-coenzyme A synthetase/AMP-(fatty) acid ligase [Cupriavidus alkaliphilus]
MTCGITLGDTLTWPARNLPHKTALVSGIGTGRRAWTFAQLDAEVNRHAHALQSLGIGKGDVVGAFLYNTPAFVFALLATARLGAVFNPVNYRLAAQELAYILNDGGARALLFEREGAAVVEKAAELAPGTALRLYADADPAPAFATHRLDTLAAEQPDTPPTVTVGENDPCILMYTSGTTGRPKGVMHTHRSKLQHNAMMHQAMMLSREDVGLSIAPPSCTPVSCRACRSALPRCCSAASMRARPGSWSKPRASRTSSPRRPWSACCSTIRTQQPVTCPRCGWWSTAAHRWRRT